MCVFLFLVQISLADLSSLLPMKHLKIENSLKSFLNKIFS